MFEHASNRPAINCWRLVALLRSNTVHRLAKARARALQCRQYLCESRMHLLQCPLTAKWYHLRNAPSSDPHHVHSDSVSRAARARRARLAGGPAGSTRAFSTGWRLSATTPDNVKVATGSGAGAVGPTELAKGFGSFRPHAAASSVRPTRPTIRLAFDFPASFSKRRWVRVRRFSKN